MAWVMDTTAIASALIAGIEGMIPSSNITIYPAKIPLRNPITGEITGYSLPTGYQVKALVIEEHRNEVSEQGKADNPVNRITVITTPTTLLQANIPVVNNKYIDPTQAQIKYRDWLFDVVRVSTPGANGTQPESMALHIEAKRVTKQPAVPVTRSSNIVASAVTTITATLTWTSGTGTSRVVFVKNTSSNAAVTLNNAQTYTANTSFGTGTQLNTTGWYCVYNGTGNTVNLTNLLSEHTYAVLVFEKTGDYYSNPSTIYHFVTAA